MSLADYVKKRGFEVEEAENKLVIKMEGYSFYIDKALNEIVLPIPLPTGKESLDDLVEMGIRYARAARITQSLGEPVTYELNNNMVLIKRRFSNVQELEQKLIKALEGIESLRYFL